MASFFPSRTQAALAALALLVPFAGSGGCGSRTACFQYSQAEFDLKMSCPAQDQALPNFTNPSCPGAIVSVDGQGNFDGQLCCYPVTYDDITSDCNGTGAFGTGGTTGTLPPPPGIS